MSDGHSGDFATRMITDNDRLTDELAAARAEVEKLRRAAKTLGKILDDSLMDVAAATDSLDLLDEDRDGDWMLIFERLAELRPARDAARAEVDQLRAHVNAARAVVDSWRSFAVTDSPRADFIRELDAALAPLATELLRAEDAEGQR